MATMNRSGIPGVVHSELPAVCHLVMDEIHSPILAA